MRLFAALALLLASVPAQAGQRATYTDDGKQQLVVLVADNGHARIDGPDPEQYGVYRDGQFYLVARKDGTWTVARTQDVAAAFAKVMPAIFSDVASAAAGQKRKPPRIEPIGKRSHLGREGKLYRINFAGAEKPGEASQFLMSADAALKPVGAALEQFTLALTMLMGAFMGPAVSDAIEETRAVFALGTPLDMEGGYKLLSLETVEVAHEAVELPAKPQTIDQIAAQIEVRAPPPEETVEPMPEAEEAVQPEPQTDAGSDLSMDADMGPAEPEQPAESPNL